MPDTPRSKKPLSIEEYIEAFPPELQKKLLLIRNTIKQAAPQATETIKYGIPTFVCNGNLISFGAWKQHIGIYPAPRAAAEFRKELSTYGGAKGTIQFPHQEALPTDLIRRIVEYNLKRNLSGKE